MMAGLAYLVLDNRGVLRLSGEDRVSFLQGLVSNDVRRAAPDRAIYTAMLTPQGRYLHDFMLVGEQDSLLLDCEAARRDDLLTRLSRFKLRSKVTLEDISDSHMVVILYGPDTDAVMAGDTGTARPLEGGGTLFVDPRLAAAGLRAILPRSTATEILQSWSATPTDWDHWDQFRLGLGLPDGSRDLEVEKALLMESGFDELHGIDWEKGCYMGQELTARTRYRGLVKKRLLPVDIDGPAPAPGTPILAGDTETGETEAGELRSVQGERGMALIRLANLAPSITLRAGEAQLRVTVPDWVRLPQNE